jgi:hypothetical protein
VFILFYVWSKVLKNYEQNNDIPLFLFNFLNITFGCYSTLKILALISTTRVQLKINKMKETKKLFVSAAKEHEATVYCKYTNNAFAKTLITPVLNQVVFNFIATPNVI